MSVPRRRGRDALPEGLELARTTPEFDEHSVPPALLDAHRVATGVWGRVVVRSGRLVFRFEDDAGAGREMAAGDDQVIPPDVPHRVVIVGPVRFAVEFHRARAVP